MNETERMVELINQKLPDIEPGTLRLWGQWFGRPYDNAHRLVGCDAPQTDLLHMHFNEGELLSIWSPRDLHIGPNTQRSRPILLIMDAARIRWEWFYYGRAHIPANRYFNEFVKASDGIEARTNVDWYAPNLQPVITEPAVEIL
jgi:hypothetical protein